MKYIGFLVRAGRSGILAAGIACCSLGWIVAAPQTVRAADTTTKEYKVKATCLFHFAMFVEWPSGAFSDATAPITIGVLGDDRFGPFLEDLVKGETVGKRPLVIKRARTVKELKACHMLFVSRSEKPRLSEILSQLEDTTILTVGESDGFAQRGGIINFFLEGERVRFEFNLKTADRRRLKISSRLLSLGKIVSPPRQKGDN